LFGILPQRSGAVGEIVEGPWQSRDTLAALRTLEGKIVKLTVAIEVLREAHTREHQSRRPRPSAEIINLR
jgi:hypothetical protein